ncbi:MAG TPA: hypothetical protein VLM88_04840 [Proteiniclasticum sp.]|nr:hypothetical protein [Proteiniclasticum sp.]
MLKLKESELLTYETLLYEIKITYVTLRQTENVLTSAFYKALYETYANKNGVSLVQIKNGKFKESIYHIQNINALHSNLRSWIQKFKGVSTKYLANYLY